MSIPVFDTTLQEARLASLQTEIQGQAVAVQMLKPQPGGLRETLTNYAAWLRDPGVDIWTESPSDRVKHTVGRDHYSLEGWRVFLRNVHAKLMAWRAEVPRLQADDPSTHAGLDDLSTSVQAIQIVWQAVVANSTDADGNLVQRLVPQGDRDALAGIIEDQLK